jgi:succinate dehydrogenase/fumarate reductase flavoprotein subunit
MCYLYTGFSSSLKLVAVISAEMKLKASIMTTESRCNHYRLDYPEPDFENWQAWINIFKADDGNMQFDKQAFGSWSVT